MDVTSIEYDDECFNLIIDKGTLDCLLCSEENTIDKINKMMEVTND